MVECVADGLRIYLTWFKAFAHAERGGVADRVAVGKALCRHSR